MAMQFNITSDFDGSLPDTLIELLDALNYAFGVEGFEQVSRDAVTDWRNRDFKDLIRSLLPEGTDPKSVERVCFRFADYMSRKG